MMAHGGLHSDGDDERAAWEDFYRTTVEIDGDDERAAWRDLHPTTAQTDSSSRLRRDLSGQNRTCIGYQESVEDGAWSIRREANRQEAYVRRPPPSGEKAEIVDVLASLFRRPLAAVFLVVMLVLGLLMVLHPSWTALALLVIGGLSAVHYVHRRARR
jgi:hypothetical protein